MLSNAVHPPTTEHVYAQWQEREELWSRPPLGLLQEDNGENLDVKEEEAFSPVSGETTIRNHFKSSSVVRFKFKGNAIIYERLNKNKIGYSYSQNLFRSCKIRLCNKYNTIVFISCGVLIFFVLTFAFFIQGKGADFRSLI